MNGKSVVGKGRVTSLKPAEVKPDSLCTLGLRNLDFISEKGGKQSPRVAVKTRWQKENNLAQNQKLLYSIHVSYRILLMNDPMILLHNGIIIQVFIEDATSLPRTL